MPAVLSTNCGNAAHIWQPFVLTAYDDSRDETGSYATFSGTA
jgi:hypothetical protein